MGAGSSVNGGGLPSLHEGKESGSAMGNPEIDSARSHECRPDLTQVFRKCLNKLQCDQISYSDIEVCLYQVLETDIRTLCEIADEFGNTLLIVAVMKNHTYIVSLLLRSGSDPDHQNNSGFCSLHYACTIPGDTEPVVKLLLESGASPNTAEIKQNCLPLHYAASGNRKGVCSLLLSYGAFAYLRCRNGFLPEAYARAAGHVELADYLFTCTDGRVSPQRKSMVSSRLADTSWHQIKDNKTDKTYYFNARTGESSWEKPIEIDMQTQGSPGHFDRNANVEDSLLSNQAENYEKKLAVLEEQMEAKLSETTKQMRAEIEAERDSSLELLKKQPEKEREIERLRLLAQAEEDKSKYTIELANKTAMMEELHRNLSKELQEKKKYFNEVEDLKGSIRIYARLRPLTSQEVENNFMNVLEVLGDNIKASYNKEDKRGGKSESKHWSFDQVFGQSKSQAEVFAETSRLITSVVDGFNVCIFAYGQTGSGKTYTLLGNQSHPGLLPRSVDELFLCIDQNKKQLNFSVELYMCELHLDSLVDLLSTNSTSTSLEKLQLAVKKDALGVVYIENITVVHVDTAKQLNEVISGGIKRRKTAQTSMNDESSRSHLVVSMIVRAEDKNSGEITCGKLTFADLAGSERVYKSHAEGQTFDEAKSINKALSSLGDVISALSTGQKHVPYRNNPLTLLMSDSLGGNAKTLMFVNVSPVDFNVQETIASLNFANRCKIVKNSVTKGFETQEIAILRKEIQKLRTQLK